MRYLMLCAVLAGCSHSAPPPPDPSGGGASVIPAGDKKATPLTIDLQLMCSPNGADHMQDIPTFGSWYEPQVVSDDMKQALAGVKSGELSVPEWNTKLAQWIAAAHITACPVRDALFSRHPTASGSASD